MEMQGERSIRASRDDVWKALNDPETLKACIPGCEELERTSDSTFEGKVHQKIGPVKARFNVQVELSDVVEAESYRISGEGKGGAAGFAKGGARVRLADDGDGTKLSYDAEAKVGGKLAQLGSRLIDGYAKKMADEFFDRFKDQLEPEGASSEEGKPPAQEARPGGTEAAPERAEAAPERAEAAPKGKTAEKEEGRETRMKPSWLDRLTRWFRQLFR